MKTLLAAIGLAFYETFIKRKSLGWYIGLILLIIGTVLGVIFTSGWLASRILDNTWPLNSETFGILVFVFCLVQYLIIHYIYQIHQAYHRLKTEE